MKNDTIYHVEKSGMHYYFGSIAAACTTLDLGIKKEALWNQRITEKKPYLGKGLTIRKGRVVRNKQKV